MASRLLPPDVASIIGDTLRQARTARGLTLTQAASDIGISVFQLQDFENGKGNLTDIHAQFIIGTYGGVRGDRLDSILYTWGMDLMERLGKAKRRSHLSIVGDDPKPWERSRVEGLV